MQRIYELQAAFDALCMEEIEENLLEWKPCSGIYNDLKWPTKTTRLHALVLRAKQFWKKHGEDSMQHNPHGGRNIPTSSFRMPSVFERENDPETEDLVSTLLRKDRLYLMEVDFVRASDRERLDAAFEKAMKLLRDLRQDVLVSCIGGFSRLHLDNTPFKTSITVIAGK